MDSLSYKKKVIGFIGHARSGKDTAAAVFKKTAIHTHLLPADEIVFVNYHKLADPIKSGVAMTLIDYLSKAQDLQNDSASIVNDIFNFHKDENTTRIDKMKAILEKYKDNNELFFGLNIRELYQQHGSIFRKQDPDIFVKLLIERIENSDKETVHTGGWYENTAHLKTIYNYHLITDIRFPNEAKLLKEHFKDDLILIKIERPELEPLIKSKTPPYNHESELHIDEIPYDIKIVNNGTLQQFEEKVVDFSKRFITLFQKKMDR